ncbi:histidine phosphatase family protein [Halalkalibacter okhensis]|uniref:Phosphoglycerate mutase n=1 Tax=Halalkalibacter okhensis TaxID=333138 RepID=A0A0B0IC50_9BACI|nr:histidine phosphatase family protein [Halalkalibacter okhensis]KHF40168.1 phosphoglycerate mutase [Halalkalibacter okhensis]
MKVGLIRHFKVERGYPNKWVTSKDLINWIREYDQSEVVENEIHLGDVKWQRCYSSDLSRAVKTAQKAYKDDIIYLEELREVQLNPVIRGNVRLPLFVHLLFIRGAWLLEHKSQIDPKKDVIKRINKTLDEILRSNEEVLIVGHGGIMMFMSRELKRRGFKGPTLRRPANGKLYIYDNMV